MIAVSYMALRVVGCALFAVCCVLNGACSLFVVLFRSCAVFCLLPIVRCLSLVVVFVCRMFFVVCDGVFAGCC